VVFLDAIVVKVRDNNVVANKPAYIAVGVDTDGHKHVLGIWLARTPLETATVAEGARFWASVMADLRNRRGPRHPDRLHRRAGRVRGRHPHRVPAHHGAGVIRPQSFVARSSRWSPAPPRARPMQTCTFEVQTQTCRSGAVAGFTSVSGSRASSAEMRFRGSRPAR
jgi:hypothetical protein